MKINFDLPIDDKYHQYCPACYSEKIHEITKQENTYYFCEICKKDYPRLIIIDPEISWWVDRQTKEYWHESIGIFLFNSKKEVLLFKRIIYPFAFSVPAGHLNKNENPKKAIIREIKEEVNLIINECDIKLFSKENLTEDPCRRGADSHKWHLFTGQVKNNQPITMNEEGIKPVWCSLDETLKKDLTQPVRFFIEKYGKQLLNNK